MIISKIEDFLLKSEFRKNVLTLFSGTFFAQLIPFLLLPILTRIFTEEQFGVFFLYTSAIVLLSIIVTLQFELAIVLPKDNAEAKHLFYITILISFIISFILLIIIIFFEKYILILLGNNDLGVWLFFIPLSTFLTGLFQAFNYWFNRKKRFDIISKSKLTKSSFAGAIQVGQGFSPIQHLGLIPGLITGQLLSNFFYLKKYLSEKESAIRFLSIKKITVYLKKYYYIPVFNTMLSSLNRLSNYLPFFLLGIFYDPTIVAFYGLAHRALSTPVGLIGQSIGQVFYQKASDLYNNSPQLFSGFIKSIYWKLAKIAILPYLALFFLASIIFEFLFGVNWAVSGTYTSILIPWLFLLFLNSPVSFIITILKKQKPIIVYDISFLICRFFALYIGYKVYNDSYYSILFFSITGFIFNIVFLIYMITISKRV